MQIVTVFAQHIVMHSSALSQHRHMLTTTMLLLWCSAGAMFTPMTIVSKCINVANWSYSTAEAYGNVIHFEILRWM